MAPKLRHPSLAAPRPAGPAHSLSLTWTAPVPSLQNLFGPSHAFLAFSPKKCAPWGVGCPPKFARSPNPWDFST